MVNEIGINAEQVSTNRQAAGYSLYEPMNEDYYNERKEGVEQVYTTFINLIAEGRNMTVAAVDSIAQGRVWTGKEALEIGLVDELGGLENAIQGAAELAGLVDYRASDYPRYQKSLEDSFKNFPFGSVKENIIEEELGEANYKIYKEIQQFVQFEGIQALMPYEIDIK